MSTTPYPHLHEPRPALGMWQRLGRDTGYSLAALPVSVISFVIVVAGISAGLSLLVVVIGIPVLVLTLLAVRGLAQTERARIRALGGRDISRAVYLTPRSTDSWWRRQFTVLRDVQSWLDAVWGVLSFATAIFAFCVVVTWWASALGGLSYWFWSQWLPDQEDSLASIIGLGEGRGPEIVLNTTFGLIAALTLPWATRVAAFVHASLGRLLLDSRPELQAELRRAVGQRTAAQEAEVESLRRLERDIHDGPQQRLVRISMDLGRARRQIASDPDRAAEIIDEALGQTRETVAELRGLSRGIAPPLLIDRGLAVALAEMSARHTSEVSLDLDLPRPLGPTLDTAIYFTVSEALTNVAKHAQAQRVRVRVAEVPGRVEVAVVDDGIGGAHLAKGSGLVGLAQRIQAVGGDLQLVSPAGGPTTVMARFPL